MRKRIIELGTKYNLLTYIGKDELRSKIESTSHGIWQCECGSVKTILDLAVIKGNTKSCGCYLSKKLRSKRKKIDIGARYNMLTYLQDNEEASKDPKIYGKRYASCGDWQCDCGKIKVIRNADVLKGNNKSCGCNHDLFNTTHGASKTVEFVAWNSMKQRCYYLKAPMYENYGGRGIKVCDRWLNSFENFFEDMGKRPSPKHSLDRKEVNGNYEQSNCRWATPIEQANNRRSNVIVKFNNELMTIAECARINNVTANKYYKRMRKKGKIGDGIEIVR